MKTFFYIYFKDQTKKKMSARNFYFIFICFSYFFHFSLSAQKKATLTFLYDAKQAFLGGSMLAC
jgi:hypothetical protein